MNPTVTVIMPVRNEGQFIARSLQAVFDQDYPAELVEILVVDGMSTDSTVEIIASLRTSHPKLQLIANPEQITPCGLNRALRLARGEIIIRVDGHCVIAPDYVRRCVNHLLEDGVAGVGGSMTTIGEDSLSETIAVSMSSPFGVGGSTFRTRSSTTLLVDTVPFAAYLAAEMRQFGMYDEELVRNQDDEYNYRIRAAGGKVLLAADVHSLYYSRGSFEKLWRQYFQYGFYKVRVMQKHPRQMSLRQFIPPVFVLTLIKTLLLTFITPWGRWLFGLVMGSYLLTNLTAAALTASRRGWQHLTLLPICFATLHLSYGLGFLAGLVKFANCWSDRAGNVPKWEAQPRL